MTGMLYLAIDIAKIKNDVLAEFPDGKRRKFKIYNKLQNIEELDQLLEQYPNHLVGTEPTSNYHRILAYYLKSRDRKIAFTPSVAVARTWEAMQNS